MVNGWTKVKIGDIATFQGGSQPPLYTFIETEKPGYIRLVQIRDYKTDKYATYVPQHLARKFCEADDIMIGRYGPPIFQILQGLTGAYNVALMKAIPKDIHKKYLWHTLKRGDIFSYVELWSRRSSGQTGVDLENLKIFEIDIPISTDEQASIAEALSDADAYIAALEKLIVKKKAVKVGAMQELLTGKRRLQGFKDEWIDKTLDELLQYEQPTKYIVSNTIYLDNGIPVLTAGKSLILGYTNDSIGVYNNLPVIIFDDFTTASKLITYPFKVKSSAMKLLTSTGACDIRLVYALMQLINFPMTDHQRYWISEYSKISVKIPPTDKEQTAIAGILSDMDAEINALTAKLDKAKAVKVGMMQQLLSGQIRLVNAETPAVAAPKPAHNKEFEDAVIISAIVNGFYNPQYPLGRVKITKLRYLLDRKRGMDVSGYKEKAAGPYDSSVRYGGGEAIAKKNGYITVKETKGKGAVFGKGDKIAGIQSYIDNWGLRADIDWLIGGFKFFSRDDLEVLATVDNARLKLEEAGQDVTVKSIVDYILQSPEWQAKREREEFADDVIAVALKQSKELFS